MGVRSRWQFIVILLATGVVSLAGYFATANLPEDERLNDLVHSGVRTTGHVVGYVGVDARDWEMRYSYEVKGKVYTGQDGAYRGERLRLGPGAAVSVSYLPDAPDVSGHDAQGAVDESRYTRLSMLLYPPCGANCRRHPMVHTAEAWAGIGPQ